MPWGYVAGAVASSVVGSALAPSGSGNGGTASGNAPPAYIPTNQSGVDSDFNSAYQQYINSVNQNYSGTNGYNQGLLNQSFNNPYASGAQSSANQSAAYQSVNANQSNAGAAQAWGNANTQVNNANQSNQLYQQGLGNVQNSSSLLYGMGNESNQTYQNLMGYQASQLPQIQNSQNNLYSAGNQVLQTSMDPQNALYNQSLQQNTDQTRAAEYARGVQTSPYGAALENSSNQNFNTNWENQQLARQTQGINSAEGAYGSAQGLGNSYTSTQAGLQAGQNEQYAGLTNAAQSQYTNYLGAMNQGNATNTQTINSAQQGANALGQQGVQNTYNVGQLPYGANQQQYTNQNQALQNFAGNNSSYLSGLNQVQSNALGYLNYGQGAQSVGYNQNMQNNQANQQAIGQIAGPIGSAVSNTNWGNIFGGSSAGSGSAYSGSNYSDLAGGGDGIF